MRGIFCFFALLFILSGCDKYYISVSQSKIDEEFLASVRLDTPDPRKEHPPLGDRLIIEWQMPEELMEKQPSLYLDVLYKDYTSEQFVYSMKHPLDYVTYDLLSEQYLKKKGILTYKVEVKTCLGDVFRSWYHQLWTKLITVEENEPSYNSPNEGWDVEDILQETHSR